MVCNNYLHHWFFPTYFHFFILLPISPIFPSCPVKKDGGKKLNSPFGSGVSIKISTLGPQSLFLSVVLTTDALNLHSFKNGNLGWNTHSFANFSTLEKGFVDDLSCPNRHWTCRPLPWDNDAFGNAGEVLWQAHYHLPYALWLSPSVNRFGLSISVKRWPTTICSYVTSNMLTTGWFWRQATSTFVSLRNPPRWRVLWPPNCAGDGTRSRSPWFHAWNQTTGADLLWTYQHFSSFVSILCAPTKSATQRLPLSLSHCGQRSIPSTSSTSGTWTAHPSVRSHWSLSRRTQLHFFSDVDQTRIKSLLRDSLQCCIGVINKPNLLHFASFLLVSSRPILFPICQSLVQVRGPCIYSSFPCRRNGWPLADEPAPN